MSRVNVRRENETGFAMRGREGVVSSPTPAGSSEFLRSVTSPNDLRSFTRNLCPRPFCSLYWKTVQWILTPVNTPGMWKEHSSCRRKRNRHRIFPLLKNQLETCNGQRCRHFNIGKLIIITQKQLLHYHSSCNPLVTQRIQMWIDKRKPQTKSSWLFPYLINS